MLEQFKRIDIVWNDVNQRVQDQIILLEGEEGRVLSVQVLNNGQLVDMTNIDLFLIWESANGHYRDREKLELVNEEKSVYEWKPVGNLLKQSGQVLSALELVEGTQSVRSIPFNITIQKGVNV